MATEENLSIARRLRAAGTDIWIEEDESVCDQSSRPGLLICLVPEREWNCAVDLGDYGTFYICYVRITSNLKRLFAPTKFTLELPWDDPEFRWLEDPHEIWPPTSLYGYFPAPSLRYEREKVLNHRADGKHPLTRGQSMEGYLLGIGGPMPEDVQHFKTIPTMFSVVDQFDLKFPHPIPLCPDRSKRILRKPSKKTTRRALFEVCDKI